VEFLPDGGHAVACESGEIVPRRPRRNHSLAFKAQVALAAIKGGRTLAQVAEQFRLLFSGGLNQLGSD
jgi:transposase